MMLKLNGNPAYRLTAGYGEIDSVHTTSHTGVDLAIQSGTKLFSPVNGRIESTPDYGNVNCGKTVIIRTDEGERVILGHLSDNHVVHAGDRVRIGDYIADTGNSGRSTGAHLHVGLRDQNNHFINPQKLFNGTKANPAPEPHTQIADAAHDIAPQIATMNPGEVLQHALNSFTEALSQMSLNVVRVVFNSSTFDLILETICTMLCI